MSLLDTWKRQYRVIYELICGNPRIEVTAISKELKKDWATASNRVREAFDKGYIIGPQIRERSYSNLGEYVYLVNCQDPLEMFLQYTEDQNIVYHARMDGFANLWVISKEKIVIEGNILVGGLRSDYHISYAPDHSWKTSMEIMWEKVRNFSPEDYQQKGIIKTHWDEPIEWSKNDKILCQELKHDLRKPLTPIMKKYGISGEKTWNWLKRLPECCTILTQYCPDTISTYDPYLYMFETDYEDFIVELFSELPTSCLFFKVSEKLILHAYLRKELLGKSNLPIFDINKLYIPLLTRELLKRNIIQKREYSVVDYYWRGDFHSGEM